MSAWQTIKPLPEMPLFGDENVYTGIYKHNVQCVKNITRDDIFNRLMKGCTFMDKKYIVNPSIIEIARQSCLLKSHFCR